MIGTNTAERITIALAAAAALITMGAFATARAEGVTIAGGPARVLDGDTLALKGVHIRLHGIDAPEGAQACTRDGTPYSCGADSTAALQAIAGGRNLICEWRDTDKYRRLVAECWVMEPGSKRAGESINAQMVRAGHAVAYRKYSDAYIEHEAQARAARRGLWAGEFQQPAEHRAAARGK